MPFWMSFAIASCLPVLALTRGTKSFYPALVGTLCFAAMLAVTLAGNVPINNQILAMNPETDLQKFTSLRERWGSLHTVRIILDIAGLCFLIMGALSRFGGVEADRK